MRNFDLFYGSHATNCQSTYRLVCHLNCHWGSFFVIYFKVKVLFLLAFQLFCNLYVYFGDSDAFDSFSGALVDLCVCL